MWTDWLKLRVGFTLALGGGSYWVGLDARADVLTGMTERDWAVVLEVFRGCLSRRGDKGRDDLLFLQARTNEMAF